VCVRVCMCVCVHASVRINKIRFHHVTTANPSICRGCIYEFGLCRGCIYEFGPEPLPTNKTQLKDMKKQYRQLMVRKFVKVRGCAEEGGVGLEMCVWVACVCGCVGECWCGWSVMYVYVYIGDHP